MDKIVEKMKYLRYRKQLKKLGLREVFYYENGKLVASFGMK